MPLSDPQPRERRHGRDIQCQGFLRQDGLWDIEGHLTDVKSYAFDNEWRGKIHPGEPLHDMWVRLTVDQYLTIQDVEAVIDQAPHQICPTITPSFTILKGEQIRPGWHLRVRKLIGGAVGCHHLTEILSVLANVAYLTIGPSRVKNQEAADPARKSRRIDSCHAFKSSGGIVKKRWPEHYTGS